MDENKDIRVVLDSLFTGVAVVNVSEGAPPPLLKGIKSQLFSTKSDHEKSYPCVYFNNAFVEGFTSHFCEEKRGV